MNILLQFIFYRLLLLSNIKQFFYFSVLESKFVTNPDSKIEVAVGFPALLKCEPPRGKPKPSVSWRKVRLLIFLLTYRIFSVY